MRYTENVPRGSGRIIMVARSSAARHAKVNFVAKITHASRHKTAISGTSDACTCMMPGSTVR